MENSYSRESLLDFLDYLAEKGLMKKGTASARKAASNNVLSILDENEASDLRNLNIESVMSRFENLKASEYTPDSLRTYKSRTRGALEDFLRYKSNPSSFKVTITSRRATNKKEEIESADKPQQVVNVHSTQTQQHAQVSERISTFDIPVPLRPGCMVQLNGIPTDLSTEEAEKISNVVLAMATKPKE